MSENKYPIGGYAPGNYQCKCSTCEKSFFGDKQAVQCEPCALASLERFNALSPAEQEEVLKRNAELANELFENLGKMTNIKQKIFNILLNHTYANRTKAADELTELFEREAKPAGAVWVNGDKNFPVRKRVVAKMFIGYLNKEVVGFASSATGEMICFDWNVSSVTLMRGHEELQNLFWLDESGAGGNDAIEFAEWILEEEYYGEDGKWWMNAYSEGAESFTTADLYKLWQQTKSK